MKLFYINIEQAKEIHRKTIEVRGFEINNSDS